VRWPFVITGCVLAVCTAFAANALQAITTANAAQVAAAARLGRGAVQTLAWSPDNVSFAVATALGVWIYNANDLEAEPRLLDGQDGAWSVAYNPAGTLLASGGADGSVMLWDAAAQPLNRLVNHLYGVNALIFSGDGLLLASADASGVMRVWDTAAGTERGVAQSEEPPVLLSVEDSDSPVVTYETLNPQATCTWMWSADHTPSVTRCTNPNLTPTPTSDRPISATSADGVHTLSATVNTGDVWVSGLDGETHLSGFMPALAGLSLDDDTITATSANGLSFAWSAAQGALLSQTAGDVHPAQDEAESPDRRLVAVGGSDGVVHIRVDGIEIQTLHGHIRGVSAVVFNPDASLLASASLDGTIRLWDMATGTAVAVLEGHTLGVTGVAFSADGSLLVSSSYDGTIRLWSLPVAP
jgi:WD40 repeat protein